MRVRSTCVVRSVCAVRVRRVGHQRARWDRAVRGASGVRGRSEVLDQRSTPPDYECSRSGPRTRAGRALIVAVYHSSGHTWKILGARDMSTDELAEYAKWEERDE